MSQQVYDWTCSICTFTWVIQATGTDPSITREQGAIALDYPNGVNPTYGLMASSYMIDAFAQYGLKAVEKWCTFEEAYSICAKTTGGISPQGMYHWMAIRGIDNLDFPEIWVANSAIGYKGVYETLTREQFNAFSPVKLIYLEQPQP